MAFTEIDIVSENYVATLGWKLDLKEKQYGDLVVFKNNNPSFEEISDALVVLSRQLSDTLKKLL